jgi:3-hydroxy-9,10-secoandrosta-1,3,5(10)-triene-9,17-dione monooxygenase reductase component
MEKTSTSAAQIARSMHAMEMSQTDTFDAAEFRRALGSFATGVTIITTRDADGNNVGLTANSFNSVSLNPPLVLWSLAESSNSLPVFRNAQHWAVHVLAADQESLSTRFAKRGVDKFAGLDCELGVDGIPLLRGCTARFECKTAFQYEGGDHVIFVGQVLNFMRADSAPLVFHSGRYADATRRDASLKPRNAYLAGSFNEDFLGYLLGRSHHQFFSKIRSHLDAEGLSDEEFYLLSTLTLKHDLTATELSAGMAGVLDDHSAPALQALLKRGLAQALPGVEGGAFELTLEGRACALRIISAAKAVEQQLLERLGPGEGEVLKSLLNRLLSATDAGASAIWQQPAND